MSRHTSVQFRDPSLQAPSLIESIYDAALDDSLWPQVLVHIADLTRSHGSHLLSFSATPAPDGFSSIGRAPVEAHHDYMAHYAGTDLRTPRLLRKTAGTICSDDELTTAEERRRCPVHQEFLPRWGVRRLLALRFRYSGYEAVLGVLRPRGAYAEEQTILRRVAPHLAKALEIRQRLTGLCSAAATLEACLDRFSFAIFTVDGKGRLLGANHAAERLASEGDGLAVIGGRLSALGSCDRGRLQALIKQAAQVGWDEPCDAGVTSITRLNGRPALHALIAPLPRAVASTGDRPVVVLVTDPGAASQPAPRYLEALYGLTPAEARLTSALAAGTSLSEYAGEVGIAVETARTHLKNAMGKTHTRRQIELVRLVLSGPQQLIGD